MEKDVESKYLAREKVEKDWPEEFHGLLDDPKVRFPTSGGVEVELSIAVKTEDSETETKTVLLHDVTAADLMASDAAKGDMAKAAMTICSSSGILMASVKKLPGRDFMRLQKVVNAFLGVGQETGETS